MRNFLRSAAILACLVAGCATHRSLSPLAPVERALIFHPGDQSDGKWDPPYLQFEDAWFTAVDGTKLHGWYVPHENPRAIALFMHGNAGNITSRAPSLAVLNRRHHLAVMAFDYRGYGRSEGTPSEAGILQDARAARAWLAKRTGVEESEIVLMGRSLGGGVAIDLAANDGARGLVLASTFTSLPAVGGHHFRRLPTRLLMTQRLNSLEKIKHYRGPLLISHGDKDSIIPYKMGRELYDAAPGPKRFVTIAGADHNDLQSEEYRVAFDEFIASLPEPRWPTCYGCGNEPTGSPGPLHLDATPTTH